MRSHRVSSLLLTLTMAGLFAAGTGRAQSSSSKVLTVDFRKLVSRADLNYDKPASRSEEGMPVGNGRMGAPG